MELTNGNDCVQIPLIELLLCPSCWIVAPPQQIEKVTVLGRLRPTLILDWTPFTIENKLNNHTFSIKSKFRLNPILANKLKKILKNPYCVYFYLNHGGYLLPITQKEN